MGLLILCLKKYRPELNIVNVAAKPTGLGLVTGLDPANTVLGENYEAILQEFVPMAYSDIASCEDEALNVIANDMGVITDWLQASRLKAAG